MPSNHLILSHPLLLLPSIFPSMRVFPNESVLYIKWSRYWSFSFSISPSNEHSGLISFRMDWLDLLAKAISRVFSNITAAVGAAAKSPQSCPTLCDPMDCSTPGFPVHHQLLEPTQTRVHCIGDPVQLSHPLSSSSPPAFNCYQHQGLFQ